VLLFSSVNIRLPCLPVKLLISFLIPGVKLEWDYLLDVGGPLEVLPFHCERPEPR
jgi:hypothetical protein